MHIVPETFREGPAGINCLCVCPALNAYCGKTTGPILMQFLLFYLVSGPIDYVKIL